ncbi:MAG: putative rane protein, partial [Nitrososphaeraceae archaeon]|nr:putative rane protein [Nitrososphaeraceae archaeon]
MFPIHDDTERIHGRPYVNYSLITINVIVFVWEIIVTGYFSDEQAVAEIFSKYGAIPRS